jgi:ribulose-phosphate 3-epimerase
MPIVAPSILAADFGNLDRDIRMVNHSDADWIHVDIMDGVFVPNISFGFPVLEAVKRVAEKPLDVHLMIVQPERFVEAFAKGGAGTITVHAEACPHLHRNIQQIKSFGCKAGVALNPHTRIDELENVISDIDLICVMSVNPGFGAQKFIEHTYQKIKDLKALIKKNNATAVIEIDGGVNLGNAKPLVDAGADVLVAGNFVFTAGDPKSVIRELKEVK